MGAAIQPFTRVLFCFAAAAFKNQQGQRIVELLLRPSPSTVKAAYLPLPNENNSRAHSVALQPAHPPQREHGAVHGQIEPPSPGGIERNQNRGARTAL